MDLKFYKKINAFAIKNGFDMQVINDGYSAIRLSVKDDGTINDYQVLTHSLYKMKNINVDSNYNTFSAVVMPINDYQNFKQFNNFKKILVDVFFTALHDGCNPEKAKQIQYEKAVNIGAENVFNDIYK